MNGRVWLSGREATFRLDGVECRVNEMEMGSVALGFGIEVFRGFFLLSVRKCCWGEAARGEDAFVPS